MTKKAATKQEREYMGRVADLGCVVCINNGHADSPAEIHHIRTGVGMAQRAECNNILPLCPAHHRIGGHGVAFHAGSKTWQENYGSELKLLRQVKRLLGEQY